MKPSPFFRRLFWCALLLSAQEIYQLGEIEVTFPSLPPSASTTFIPIDSSWTQLDLESALQRIPGVVLRKTGWWESFSTISIRGSFPRHSTIYLEDLPLNSIFTGGWNLNDVPISALEKLEVSVSPGGYSGWSVPIGGILRLRLRSEPSSAFSLTTGSFSSRNFAFHHFSPQGGVSYRRLYSSADFPFWSNAGTPENPDDDSLQYRQNNWINREEISLRTSLKGKRPINTNLLFLKKEQGLAGLGYASTQNAKIAEEQTAMVFQCYTCQPLFSLYAYQNRSAYSDLYSELSLQPTHNVYRALLFGGTFQHPLSTSLSLNWSFREELFRIQKYHTSEFPPLYRRFLSYAGMRYQGNKRLEWAGGVEWAGFRSPWKGSLFIPTGWLGYTAPMKKGWLFGHIWTGGKVPSFSEQYGDFGFLVPNPELKEERSVGMGFGARLSRDKWQWELSVFGYLGRNWIVLWQNSQRSIQAYNAQRVQALGIESRLIGRLGKSNFSIQFTQQEVKDISDTVYRGKQLPGQPQYQSFTAIDFPAFANSILRLEWEHIYGWYLDRANLYPIMRRNLISIVWEIKNPAVHIRIDNLLNRATQDFLGFPRPGRTFLLTIQHIL